MKVKWWSPSALKKAMACLRRYKFEEFKERSGPMKLGNFRHDVLRRHYRTGISVELCYQGARGDRVEGFEFADQKVQKDLERYVAKYPRPEEDAIFSVEGDRLPPEMSMELYGEMRFAVMMSRPGEPPWGVRGTMDLVYYHEPSERIVVVDHKGRTEEDIFIQAIIYILAAREMWGWEGVKIAFHANGCPPYWSDYLVGREDKAHGSKEISFSEAEQALRQIVATVMAAEAAGEFPATVCDDCDFCTIKEGCPALSSDEHVVAPSSWLPPKLAELPAPDLVKLHDKTQTHIKALTTVKKMVAEAAVPKMQEQGGVVQVDGRDRKLSQKTTYEDHLEGFISLAQDLGVEVYQEDGQVVEEFSTPPVDVGKLRQKCNDVISQLPKDQKGPWLDRLMECRMPKKGAPFIATPRGILKPELLLEGVEPE